MVLSQKIFKKPPHIFHSLEFCEGTVESAGVFHCYLSQPEELPDSFGVNGEGHTAEEAIKKAKIQAKVSEISFHLATLKGLLDRNHKGVIKHCRVLGI